MESQASRVLDHIRNGTTYISVEELNLQHGGITEENTRRWQVLQGLRERNLTLYFNILINDFPSYAPIIYTPNVAWACSNWHKLARHPQAMFFSAADKGEMKSMVHNWPVPDVQAIVVTDGSRILGLGDLGINGLGIPCGKLDLYIAAAGFHPGKVLPAVIDVGTNNVSLREDPWYQGLRQPRLTGESYLEVLDEFVDAIRLRWPHAVLQFEDFSTDNAALLLARYRYHNQAIFNDDIQGTAAVAVAGLLGAMRVLGKPVQAITEESTVKIVMCGGGSAGTGVVTLIKDLMVSMGLSEEEARGRFHIVDKDGLITNKRTDLPPSLAQFARRAEEEDEMEGQSLTEVVRRVKPTTLIGLSGAGPLFTPEILNLMARNNKQPIIMPMSNPTIRMEASHSDVQKACNGHAIFASGSPQPDVTINGKLCRANQANNMFIFPAIALASFLSKGNVVTDRMIMAAAKSLPNLLTEEDIKEGKIFPSLGRIRDITVGVTAAIIEECHEEGHLKSKGATKALAKGMLEIYIRQRMYVPAYRSLVHV
jgi:malate dehydrogenase (decarboxylating)